MTSAGTALPATPRNQTGKDMHTTVLTSLSALAAIASYAPAQSPSLITEYFNNGVTGARAGCFYDGTGWNGRRDSSDVNLSASNLSVSLSGYSNCGNWPVSEGGLSADSGTSDRIVSRVNGKYPAGEIWVSFVVLATADPGHVQLQINGKARFGVEVANSGLKTIRGVVLVPRSTIPTQRGSRTFSRTSTALVVAKIVWSPLGGNELVSLWLQPNISAQTEAGLGAPDVPSMSVGNLSNPNPADAGLTNIALVVARSTQIDALRVAFDPFGATASSTASKVKAILNGRSSYPGSDGDVELRTAVYPAFPAVTTRFPDKKSAKWGDYVDMNVVSVDRSLNGELLFATASLVPSNNCAALSGLYRWLDPNGWGLLVQPAGGVWTTVRPGGTRISIRLPPQPGMGPMRLLLQSYVLRTIGGGTCSKPARIYSTDAHELIIT